MQFIPSTWSVVGVDADGDAQRNPQDIDDASLATAVYLCSGDDDLGTDAGRREAVYRYNHSKEYVDLVLRIMQAYMDGDFTSVPNNTTSAVTFTPDYDVTRPTLVPKGNGGNGGRRRRHRRRLQRRRWQHPDRRRAPPPHPRPRLRRRTTPPTRSRTPSRTRADRQGASSKDPAGTGNNVADGGPGDRQVHRRGRTIDNLLKTRRLLRQVREQLHALTGGTPRPAEVRVFARRRVSSCAPPKRTERDEPDNSA